jgi:hypothetical protein
LPTKNTNARKAQVGVGVAVRLLAKPFTVPITFRFVKGIFTFQENPPEQTKRGDGPSSLRGAI